MGILKGKDTALEHIEKSKLAFLATLSEAEKGPSSTHTMPPTDHFTLKFDRDSIRNLKGRVYENMKQYVYEQRGESIPALFNNKGAESSVINPTKPSVPTIGHHYVACIYDDLKVIDCLIEIGRFEIDELVKTANARRKSVV